MEYTVTYSKLYTCGLGCYNGFTQHLDKTNTLFYLVPLTIGQSIVCGNVSSTPSTVPCDVQDLIYRISQTPFMCNVGPLITYALLKMILGRVLFGEFNSKWLYRDNYKEFTRALLKSPYVIFYDDYLGPNKSFEIYFNYSQCDSV